LIDTLIDSLDEEVDQNVEDTWRVEIRRRLQQIDSGSVQMILWDQARLLIKGQMRS
jgi:putative addiction module component (TIGR02574 family)